MGGIAKRTGEFVETTIDDEVVAMELAKGEFFSITGTGLAIWKLIDGTRGRDALVEELAKEFDAPKIEIASDVDAFLASLRNAGLIDWG
ncbi:MAG TPA: PqqD family protein [Sphingomonadaceae bacterium]|nr:PqqD family protein [Sphingomonadaceae bacterium]